MSSTIVIIFLSFFILRLSSLFFSIKNEKRLKKEGAVEYGKTNSTVMAILHTVFYFACLTEAAIKKTQFDSTTVVGISIYLFSMAALFFVIYQLRDVWTVKLLIAKSHKLNKSFVFKYIRHPNYFLNILPELIAIVLICKSWIALAVIFPFYLATMVIRITQEEKVMKQKFTNF
ncbi:MAG: isoprenylcysteine carboxyl methyltransferase family protein [Clostridia bacterium]|nr:isoprenylcysteine carboxyl methyltransferase family protein [Clostridia bacterium]